MSKSEFNINLKCKIYDDYVEISQEIIDNQLIHNQSISINKDNFIDIITEVKKKWSLYES